MRTGSPVVRSLYEKPGTYCARLTRVPVQEGERVSLFSRKHGAESGPGGLRCGVQQIHRPDFAQAIEGVLVGGEQGAREAQRIHG